MKKKILLSVLCICMVLTMMPTVGYGATRAVGDAPVFDNTINYCIWADGTTTSSPQLSLTNYEPQYAFDGTWRFYTAPTGGTEVAGIRSEINNFPGGVLVLELTVPGTVDAGTYWASFTPNDTKIESPRSSFTLKKLPTLQFKQPTVYKTTEGQESLTVDLVGDYPELTDWVVKATTPGNAGGTGTSWGHPQQLVLTSSYDAIKKGTYDISYKIYGKESNKAQLTIGWKDAKVSIKTKTYLLNWGVNLEITKEDGSQNLAGISYQVGSETSGNMNEGTDYIISQDKKTVSFTKEKIANIVGADIGEGKEVTFIFKYTGGPSVNNVVTQKILVRQSAKKNDIKWRDGSIWEQGNKIGLWIEPLVPAEQVRRISVDGKMIRFGDDETTQDGNVFNDESIKISPEYLEKLEIGSHTIKIYYEDSIEKEYTTGTTNPIDKTEWTSYSEDTFEIVNKRTAEATPNAMIDYVNEKLTGLVTSAAYSITPSGGTASTISADTNGEISINSQWLGKDLSIIKTGDGVTTKDSEAQILSIPTKTDTPAAPTATKENIKDDSITLTALEGAEYKINNGIWQSNPNFTGLEANTKYSFYQRIKAVVGKSFSSDTSTVKEITTDKTTLTVTAPAADGIYGQPLSELKITGEVVTDKGVKVDGTWKFNDTNASGIFPAVSGVTSYTATFTPNANVDKYKTLTAEITPRINYLDTEWVATIADTNKGTNDWYKGTATVNAPSGYYININQDITNFGKATSLEINETKDLTYYLREISTGKISSEKTLAINIDKTKPNISNVISSAIKDVSATVTVTAKDIESGIKNYYIYISTSNIDNVSAATIKKDGKSNTTGVFNLTSLKALTKYNFAVLATDNATNESNITKGNFTTLGAPTPPTPTPTPTTDPTAPIQPKEQTITNADGTKTTVILFDGTKSGTPAKGEALLSAEALAKIAAVKGAGAVVATSTAIVQFDQKALQAITGGQTKGNIKVIAEIVNPDTLTPEEKALLGDNALIIDLSVENENGKVTDFNGGTATVTINIPAGVDPTTLGAVYIKTNGKLEKVEGKVVMVNGVATFQFVTNHFSKFAVLDKATIDKAIAAQEAMAKDKLVKGIKATKLTAIKAVAKKSNVTVTWKKSKGYKVDGYQIWKSSKKTTGYKMMAKRTGQKYKNTYGLKAGKTYYYKVRGFREIDGKIVYTKWAKAKVVAK